MEYGIKVLYPVIFTYQKTWLHVGRTKSQTTELHLISVAKDFILILQS
jgi:hypothetical protein